MLGLQAEVIYIPLGIAPQRLPGILSRQEIAQLFAVTAQLGPRTFLMLACGTGLRLSELWHLRAADIDSHADRMCIRIVRGMGGKDCYIPQAEDVLQLLRTWGTAPIRDLDCSPARVTARSRSTTQPLRSGTRARAPVPASPSAGAFTRCATAMQITCATHLLKAGTDLHSLSQWLGHRQVCTTSRYLHLARPDAPRGARRDPLKLL